MDGKRISIILAAVALAVGTMVGCDKEKEAVSEATEPARGSEPEKGATRVAAKSDNTGKKDKAGDDTKDSRYSVAAPEQPLLVGQSTTLGLTIEPGSGFKINKEYPWKVEFEAPEGVELTSAKIEKGAMTLQDSEAKIPVEMNAKQAGDVKLSGVANFSVCNDDRCEILRDRRLTFALEAVAPPGEGK